MVLPPPAADDSQAADWLKDVVRPLRIAQRKVRVLVAEAHPAWLRATVLALRSLAPDLRVLLRAPDLREVPPGALVLLRVNEEDAAWLNLNRPLFAEQEWRVVLWAEGDMAARLRRLAPDFFSWSSHPVFCPPGVPEFTRARLRLAPDSLGLCWEGGPLLDSLRAVWPSLQVHEADGSRSFRSLRKAAAAGGGRALIWQNVQGWSRRVVRLRFAMAMQSYDGLPVLDCPGVRPQGWCLAHNQPMDWGQAAELLGGPEGAARAALLDLEPEAIRGDLSQKSINATEDPWQTWIEAVRAPFDRARISSCCAQLLQAGLADVALDLAQRSVHQDREDGPSPFGVWSMLAERVVSPRRPLLETPSLDPLPQGSAERDIARVQVLGLHLRQGQLQLARQLLEELPETELQVQACRLELAFLQAQGAERLELARRRFALWEGETEHPGGARARRALAFATFEAGRPQEALPLAERALQVLSEAWGPGHPETALARGVLGEIQLALGAWEPAQASLSQAIGDARLALPTDHWALDRMTQALEQSLRATGEGLAMEVPPALESGVSDGLRGPAGLDEQHVEEGGVDELVSEEEEAVPETVSYRSPADDLYGDRLEQELLDWPAPEPTAPASETAPDVVVPVVQGSAAPAEAPRFERIGRPSAVAADQDRVDEGATGGVSQRSPKPEQVPPQAPASAVEPGPAAAPPKGAQAPEQPVQVVRPLQQSKSPPPRFAAFAPPAESSLIRQRQEALGGELKAAYAERASLGAKGGLRELSDAKIQRLKNDLRGRSSPLVPGYLLGDGRFELLELVGQGGYAGVWTAHDQQTGQLVAIKILHAHKAADTRRRAQFERAISTLQGIHHPALVSILSSGEEAGLPYYAMPYLSGGTLNDLVTGQHISTEGALRAAMQAGEGVAELHRLGLVHRDIKPHNILLNPQGQAQLTDMDMATLWEEQNAQTNDALGTVVYAAPELFEGVNADPRSDVYSLAVTLVFCVLGRTPAPSALRDPAALVRELPLGPQVAKLLVSALSWDPAERPADAGQLVAAMRAAMQAPPPTAPAAPVAQVPQVRAASRWSMWVAVATWAGLGGLLMTVLWNRGPDLAPLERPSAPELQSFQKNMDAVNRLVPGEWQEVSEQSRVSERELSQVEWDLLMDENPSEKAGAFLPVHGISFLEAVEYCNQRSKAEGLSPAYLIDEAGIHRVPGANGYRLPSRQELLQIQSQKAVGSGSYAALNGAPEAEGLAGGVAEWAWPDGADTLAPGQAGLLVGCEGCDLAAWVQELPTEERVPRAGLRLAQDP